MTKEVETTNETTDSVNSNTGQSNAEATKRMLSKSMQTRIQKVNALKATINEIISSSRTPKEMREDIAKIIEESGFSNEDIKIIMNHPSNKEFKEQIALAITGKKAKENKAVKNQQTNSSCSGINLGIGDKLGELKGFIKGVSEKSANKAFEVKENALEKAHNAEVKGAHKPAFDEISSNITKLNKVINNYGIGDRDDIKSRAKDKKKMNTLISKIDERFDEAKNATRNKRSKGLLTSQKEKDSLTDMYKNAKEEMKDSTKKLTEKAKKFEELKEEQKRMDNMLKTIMEFIENMFKGVANILTFGRVKMRVKTKQPTAA
ncbi:MAG: hypothetical protein OIF36_00630 [Alphaproteobacteria bacterium]|nr:hypothetical protein [Alphaproteobacteria bacterium]